MAEVIGLSCLRCGTLYPPDHYAEDCPRCRPLAPSNLAVAYDPSMRTRREGPTGRGGGLWRYGEVLPVEAADAVSLAEGGSPLHRLDRLGHAVGMTRLFAKDETRNPTWSFKDRLACVAVSRARRMGASVIVSSSTGNAGAAAAAYAAKAGLRCVIFTVQGASGPMMTQMRAYGATVVAVENKADRWTLMQHAVREYGWFPTSPFFGPAVGSNPYGIEGYKTLAYEIAEQMDWQVPDCCILPVCYGDALLGVWRGFDEMRAFGWTDRMPRLFAAEVYGSLSAALARGSGDALNDMPRTHDTVATSISATRSTFQALQVIRQTGGGAVAVGNADAMRCQRQLARDEALYVEPSSATAVAALESFRRSGKIREAESVVLLLTASGLKDPSATEPVLPQPLLVRGTTETAIAMLKEAGVFPASRAP
ncbi:MAG: threonine synthase [Xanthobacteraceae bacterium]